MAFPEQNNLDIIYVLTFLWDVEELMFLNFLFCFSDRLIEVRQDNNATKNQTGHVGPVLAEYHTLKIGLYHSWKFRIV